MSVNTRGPTKFDLLTSMLYHMRLFLIGVLAERELAVLTVLVRCTLCSVEERPVFGEIV